MLDLALFVPGGDKGSLTALYAAVRQAFGADVVQIWRQGLKEVPEREGRHLRGAGSPGAQGERQPQA
ncbi:hypothetical protein GCM10023238_35350 [Streptomyces heliomycini]